MHLFCHEQPDTLVVQTEIADARPGKVTLTTSPFYPGGGGQLADRGVIRWNGGEAKVVGFEYSAGKLWHLLDTQSEVAGARRRRARAAPPPPRGPPPTPP